MKTCLIVLYIDEKTSLWVKTPAGPACAIRKSKLNMYRPAKRVTVNRFLSLLRLNSPKPYDFFFPGAETEFGSHMLLNRDKVKLREGYLSDKYAILVKLRLDNLLIE